MNGENRDYLKNNANNMKDYARNVYEFNTLGFTIVENVVDADTISKIKAELKNAISDDRKWFAHHERKNPDLVVDLSIHNPLFLRVLDNDNILNVLYTLLDKTCTLYSYTSTILNPKVKETAVQQMHVDTNKFIPNFVSGVVMTLALEDFTDENGATLYLPGSQNLKEAPSVETFSKYAISTARNAGDALFFNPRVYHKAANNNTDNIRYGLTMYATWPYFKQRFDFPRMIPGKSLEGLSDRLLAFLGFNARMPDTLDQYYSKK